MKKIYFLLVFLISICSFGQVINEFMPNPIGTDPNNTSIELKGTPNASFSGWILSVECDASNDIGIVDRATNISGTFDANGLLVVSIPDLENPSFTIVLVSSFSGAVGVTDIDTDDDGTADDTSTFGTIYDAIGIPDAAEDESSIYGTYLGGSNFTYTGDEPRLVFRDGITGDLFAINDDNNGATDEIYDVNATLVFSSDFNVNPSAADTLGAVNPIYIATASIGKNEIENFSVYPNPVKEGRFRITSTNRNVRLIRVFDMLGKKVLDKKVQFDEIIRVDNLNAGIYILKVEEEGKIATRKLVIE